MNNKNEKTAFIKKIHLKGFKSVKDLEVTLHNGLNIVIGPNGSGKTNFVEFLKFALSSTTRLKIPYFFEIIFNTITGEKKLQEVLDNKLRHKDFEPNFSPIKTKLIDVNLNKEYFFDRSGLFLNLNRSGNNDLLSFCLSTCISYKSEPCFQTFMFSELGEINVDHNTYLYDTLPDIFEAKIFELEDYPFQDFNKVEELVQTIKEYFIINKLLLSKLNQYSPIKAMRLSDSMKVSRITEGVKLEYLMLEFFVNNTWLKWGQLSDGTRRIFDIIYQVMISTSSLILLEEPENGVHPDQLYRLMDFLKEQSKTKQIIITTHSPEVLNILEKDELDRIIVTRYDDEKGTLMHHLSENKIKKAKRYMSAEGLALKDYWVHSNLEEIDETTEE